MLHEAIVHQCIKEVSKTLYINFKCNFELLICEAIGQTTLFGRHL